MREEVLTGRGGGGRGREICVQVKPLASPPLIKNRGPLDEAIVSQQPCTAPLVSYAAPY
jgi:hypothetical protein